MSFAAPPYILTYHSIAEGTSPLRIPPALFAEQVQWLRQIASVISLAELVRHLETQQPLPPRTVVLTFDDGFADFYTHAAPVLREAKLPATVFLISRYCGKTNRWPGQPAWVEEQPLMSWEQVRELAQEGFTFGAHTQTHPNLAAMERMRAFGEVIDSGKEIAAQLGTRVEFFCYPYGAWDVHVRMAVRGTYRAACSTRTGAVPSLPDLLLLPRIDAHLVRNPAVFRRMFTPHFLAYVAARRLVRRLRGFPEN